MTNNGNITLNNDNNNGPTRCQLITTSWQRHLSMPRDSDVYVFFLLLVHQLTKCFLDIFRFLPMTVDNNNYLTTLYLFTAAHGEWRRHTINAGHARTQDTEDMGRTVMNDTRHATDDEQRLGVSQQASGMMRGMTRTWRTMICRWPPVFYPLRWVFLFLISYFFITNYFCLSLETLYTTTVVPNRCKGTMAGADRHRRVARSYFS